MNAVIYFSFSRNHQCKQIAEGIDGDHFEINPNTVVKGIYLFHMFIMGYRTVKDRPVILEELNVDFNQYDTIHLVFPIWAGRPAVYVKRWLQENPFTQKKVYFHVNSGGGNKEYANNIESFINKDNEVVEKTTYKNGIKIA